MKIPIDIRVKSERIAPNPLKRGEEIPETEDFKVSGTLKKTKNGFRIEYNEENDTVTTTIDTFEDDTVSVNRVGPINTHMVFTYTC